MKVAHCKKKRKEKKNNIIIQIFVLSNTPHPIKLINAKHG
jgi:hypothetical protein